KNAKKYHLRGDFLVHCHVEMHMMQGLSALVRSHQTVWLTPAQKHELETTVGLPLDPGDNACPAVKLDRCSSAVGGQWEELPNLPEVAVRDAGVLGGSDRMRGGGGGEGVSGWPVGDQTRLWDQTTGLYTHPANQPYG